MEKRHVERPLSRFRKITPETAAPLIPMILAIEDTQQTDVFGSDLRYPKVTFVGKQSGSKRK